MSSNRVSSFRSSSDCSTAHILQRDLDSPELDSRLYSATLTRPSASAVYNESGMASLDSAAFASPLSRLPTGVSATPTPSPGTARGARRLGGVQSPGISVVAPVTPVSPSLSSNSGAASSVNMTLPPQRKTQISPSNTKPQDADVVDTKPPTPPSARTTHKKHGLLGLLHIHGDSSRNAASASAPAHSHHALSQQSSAATTAATAFGASASLPTLRATVASPPRRAVSSPMVVPATRGSGSDWLRRPCGDDGDSTAAGDNAARTTRAPSRLPPLRPPSNYFATGSNTSGSSPGSRRNSGSHAASPTSRVGGGGGQGGLTSYNTALRSPLPHNLASVRETDAENSGWWAATRRYAASKADLVNVYLEKLINPGAVNLATVHAHTAAAQARTRRASQLLQPLPGSAWNSTSGGGQHSRTASASSGFDGAFDVERRAPPPRPPISPSRSGVAGNAAHRFPLESFSSATQQDGGANNGDVPLDVVVIDPAREPFVWNDPVIPVPEVHVETRDEANDVYNNVGDVSGSDDEGGEGEPNNYVVDLLSALRGYLTSPTEPFGHLVAAALASRSAENPVHGFEVAAAEHNPFLVRMIVDSGTLEVQDEEAQRNVQDTVDELIPATEGELSPGIYEYLSSFFKMPFVRLSHGQYSLLKRSGYEYIKLMYDHQHVLPDEPFHSILVNESRVMHVVNIVFMIIELCSIIFCTVTVALVLAMWMKMDNNNLQSYGFYTLIVYGGGWALYLIFIIYATRSRQDEQRYEPQERDSDRLLLPSPYVAVVPVIPLFDILCVLKYFMAVRKKRMILGHNIVASSRLSGAFYAVWFAFPQLIAQSYFNNIELSIEAQYRHRWAYTMLIVAVIIEWSVAILGYISFLFTHDSIDGFGFACFNMGRVPHLLERHNAAAHTLHFLTAFVLETNVYLVTANGIIRPVQPPCDSYWNVVLALSAFSVFYIIVVYFAITLTDASAVRISFTSIALVAIQIALCVCSERLQRSLCEMFRHYYFRGTFVFGYLSWGAYFAAFIVWLIMMLQWYILGCHKLNLFPRVLCPYARRDGRFTLSKKSEQSSAEREVSSHTAVESKEEAAHSM